MPNRRTRATDSGVGPKLVRLRKWTTFCSWLRGVLMGDSSFLAALQFFLELFAEAALFFQGPMLLELLDLLPQLPFFFRSHLFKMLFGLFTPLVFAFR